MPETGRSDRMRTPVGWNRTGVARRPVGIARPRHPGFFLAGYPPRQLGTALETWIDQAERVEPLHRPAIVDEMPRLPPHRGFPCDPEPSEVLVDRRLEFRPAAVGVDVLDAQQKPSPSLTGQIEIQQGRISVAEMKITVRARRKTEDGWH